jgi:hypothetical protein
MKFRDRHLQDRRYCARDERRYSFRPSKAARLRVGARVVAIESDRFSTGR